MPGSVRGYCNCTGRQTIHEKSLLGAGPALIGAQIAIGHHFAPLLQEVTSVLYTWSYATASGTHIETWGQGGCLVPTLRSVLGRGGLGLLAAALGLGRGRRLGSDRLHRLGRGSLGGGLLDLRIVLLTHALVVQCL